MAKMSLLEIVQDIMSDMDSDEVNSINDTQESLQVAQIVKTTYFNIIDGRDFDFLHEMFQLTASSDLNKPSHMKLPETVIDVDFIKYNCRKKADTKDYYKTIMYKTPEDFLYILDQRNSSDSDVKVVDGYNGITLNIYNDKGPSYFTSFDDENIVFDAYDKAVEDTLTMGRTKCRGKRSVTFTLSDTFTPDLPVQMFSYLLAEAKSIAFTTLKQTANPKAEQQSVTQKRRMSQDSWRIKNGIHYPNYGRTLGHKGKPGGY